MIMRAVLWPHLFWLLTVCLTPGLQIAVYAQSPDCTDALAAAEQAYIFGRFTNALTTLNQCLELGDIPLDQRRQALRLMSVTYLADNQRDAANQYAHLLLDVAPDYTPDPFADPPQFAMMIQQLKTDRRNPTPPPTPADTTQVNRLNNSPLVAFPLLNLTLTQNTPDTILPLAGERPPLRDPDGDPLLYGITVQDTAIVSASIASGLLTLRPKKPGRTELTLSAEDPSGLWAATSFQVIVEAAALPVIRASDTTAVPPPTVQQPPPDTAATAPPILHTPADTVTLPRLPPAPPKDNRTTRGRALLDRIWTALGGKEAVQQIRSVRQTGRVTLQTRRGLPETFVVLFQQPDRMRIEIGTPTGIYLQYLKGNAARFRMPGRTPQPHNVDQMQANLWLEPLYLLARAGEAEATFLGTEAVGEITCDVLELTPPGAASRRLYIDPATWRIIKIGENVQDGLLLSDYRPVGNVQVPFRRRSTRNNQPVAEIQYTDIQINIPLDDTLFQQP